jgi:cardiolipin synthase
LNLENSANSYVECKQAQFVKAGPDYLTSLYELIDNAQFNIHFHVYIFLYDDIGKEVIRRLKLARERGVSVYLLIDGLGSFNFPNKVMEEIKQAGIHARFFGVWFREGKFHIGRRLHSKVVVVDSYKALVGGINIGEPFLAGEKIWLDYALLVHGGVGSQLHRYCNAIFDKKRNLRNFHSHLRSWEHSPNALMVRTVINDFLWFFKRDIEMSYRHKMADAEKEILLVQSYFVPWPSFIFQLRRAVRRGIRVVLVLPKISDIPLLKQSTEFYYERLLKYGIEIWEWPSTILHAKMLLVDGSWLSIGSYNVNFTSRFGNVEVNLEVQGAGFVKEVRQYLETGIFPLCHKIERGQGSKNIFYQLRLLFAYTVVALTEMFSKLFGRVP